VRDYVHVCDLAAAHLLALERLFDGWQGGTYNLGNSRGHSVLEVVRAARAVTRRPVVTYASPRRAGDPAVLIAGSSRARAELGWRPQYEALGDIIATAWRWHAGEVASRLAAAL